MILYVIYKNFKTAEEPKLPEHTIDNAKFSTSLTCGIQEAASPQLNGADKEENIHEKQDMDDPNGDQPIVCQVWLFTCTQILSCICPLYSLWDII